MQKVCHKDEPAPIESLICSQSWAKLVAAEKKQILRPTIGTMPQINACGNEATGDAARQPNQQITAP